MSDIKSLKSYLVSLGFDANMSQYLKFESVLKDAKSLVHKITFEMGVDLLKWQTAVTGSFVGTSAAIIGTVAKVAMADQEFRLFGQRMLLDTNQARALKISLDALGQPIEAIAFDPELHSRYEQLAKDQRLLAGGLGGDFEGTMKQIRDVMFEFTRLEVEFKYFTFSVAKELFQALGGGDFIKQLHRLNDWIISNIPNWSRQFATYLVPILKDTWRIVKDLGILFLDLATIFTNFVGVLSGDNSLNSKTFDFGKFATAVDKTANAVAWLLEKLIALEGFLAQHAGALGLGYAGAKIGSIFGPEGTVIGGAGGVLTGFILDTLRGPASNAGTRQSGAESSTIADQARTLAAQVGAKLGIDPSIIFAQWAHETGGFTNRGATQLNNLAGINVPGGNGTDYRSFNSLQSFGDYYSSLISSKYQGVLGASSVDQFATGLKAGGYFSGPLDQYEKGMQYFQPSYGGGSHSSVSIGDINIMQPNATPDQIKNAVKDAIVEHTALQTKRSLTQTRTIYA